MAPTGQDPSPDPRITRAPDLEAAAQGFAAMGSPARLEVLRLLVRAGPAGLSVGEIGGRSGIAPSTLAHHLRALAEAGVIEQRRQGRVTRNIACFDRLHALAGYILAECCLDERWVAPALAEAGAVPSPTASPAEEGSR